MFKSKPLYLLLASLLLTVLVSACGDPTATAVPAATAAATTAAATTAARTSAAATTAAATTAMVATTAAATTAAATTAAAMTAMPGMTSAAATTAGATTAAAGAAATGTINITIQDFKFAPDTMMVKVGTKVIWTNKDSSAHTVTEDKNAFTSELIKQNATYEYTFTKAGTFSYFCQPHPFMKGKIVVTE